jgi:hypothetical protein
MLGDTLDHPDDAGATWAPMLFVIAPSRGLCGSAAMFAAIRVELPSPVTGRKWRTCKPAMLSLTRVLYSDAGSSTASSVDAYLHHNPELFLEPPNNIDLLYDSQASRHRRRTRLNESSHGS